MKTIPSHWLGTTLVKNDSQLDIEFIEDCVKYINNKLDIKLTLLSITDDPIIARRWLGLYTVNQKKVNVILDKSYVDRTYLSRYTNYKMYHETIKEYFFSILAHEMRHCWQDKNGWDMRDSKVIEVDAETFQYNTLKEWRSDQR